MLDFNVSNSYLANQRVILSLAETVKNNNAGSHDDSILDQVVRWLKVLRYLSTYKDYLDKRETIDCRKNAPLNALSSAIG